MGNPNLGRQFDPYQEYGIDRSMPLNAPIVRGMGVVLPPDVHSMVHNPAIPSADRARALVNYVKSTPHGIGEHWSTSAHVASEFADFKTMMKGTMDHHATSVIFHANPPDPANVDTHTAYQGGSAHGLAFSYDDAHGEQEVPLKSGNAAEINRVSWRTISPREERGPSNEYQF
jgi:hypothetical protein